MLRRRLAAACIGITLGVLLAPDAWAASPTAILGSFFERTNAVLRSADPSLGLEEPRRAIRLLITEVFDFRDAAAMALGPAWPARTAREQEEFIQLFTDLLERGYIAAFSSKARLAGGISVQYLDESITGESAFVPTRVLTRAGEDLPVDYRLVRRGEAWAVRDVVIDGVSMVANYRAQFARILGTSSFADLMTKMSRDGLIIPSPLAPLAAAALPAAVATLSGSAPALPASPDPAMDASRNGQTGAVSVSPSPAPPAARSDLAPPARPTEDRAALKTELKLAPAAPSPGAGKVEQTPAKAPVKSEPVGLGTSRVQYWVQLGTFQTIAAAKRLTDKLLPQIASIVTSPASSAGAPAGAGGASPAVSRVRVGPFEDEALAATKLRELQARGYGGFIARIQN